MSLFGAIIVGVIVGGIAGYFIKGSLDYLLINLLAGIIGSLIGLVIYFLIVGINQASSGIFSGVGTLCSVVGALLLVLAYNGVHHVMPRRVSHASHVEENEVVNDLDED